MSQTEQLYRSIDDYLGPSETRFFASGYRRARYDVRDLTVTSDGDQETVTAAVSVAYPADWSTKAERTDLRPHLSTIDVLVLAVQLSEAHLAHACRLDGSQRRASRLRKVSLRAGQVPQEDLDGMSASAVQRSTTPVRGSEQAVSVYDCAVGALRARVEIVHPLPHPPVSRKRDTAARRIGRHESLAAVLGPAGERYYGDGFQRRRQLIQDVAVDMEALAATALVRVEPTAEINVPAEGIEGDLQPSFSMIDGFVASLQLGQVLLYELDTISRERSNTLWMVRTVLEAADGSRPCTGPLPARMAISRKHLVSLRGGTWRNVDFEGACGGITLRASFAHQLPADERSGTPE